MGGQFRFGSGRDCVGVRVGSLWGGSGAGLGSVWSGVGVGLGWVRGCFGMGWGLVLDGFWPMVLLLS
jgi:hypothetical protein